jgi:expansin (peptidoglycan-binding protein)
MYTGQGTFYATGLGACGITNNDGQDIAAVSHMFFDAFPGYNGINPNTNPLCGKTARVTYQGTTIEVQLTDRCGGCQYGDLDFSPHAFNQLADPSQGRISNIEWEIID